MFNLAVIPPMMLDARQRSHRFHNENGLIADPLGLHSETMLRVQFWSPEERETFKEKYVIHPKNFGYIASALENKVDRHLCRFDWCIYCLIFLLCIIDI